MKGRGVFTKPTVTAAELDAINADLDALIAKTVRFRIQRIYWVRPDIRNNFVVTNDGKEALKLWQKAIGVSQ